MQKSNRVDLEHMRKMVDINWDDVPAEDITKMGTAYELHANAETGVNNSLAAYSSRFSMLFITAIAIGVCALFHATLKSTVVVAIAVQIVLTLTAKLVHFAFINHVTLSRKEIDDSLDGLKKRYPVKTPRV